MNTPLIAHRSNMDHCLQCAAKLNNAAISTLAAGKRQEALDLFRNALEALTVQEMAVAMEPAVHGDDFFPATVDKAFLPFIPFSTPYLSIPFNRGSEAFTYSKVFLFNPSLELDAEYICSLRAVIQFNMALIYQQVSLHSYDEYEEMALALYNEAIEFLEADNLDDLDYVFIAAQNNKAQIHLARKDDPQDTRLMLEEVGSALRQHMKKRIAVFDDQDTDALLLNVLCQGILVSAPVA